MTRINNIPRNDDFYKALKLMLNKFATEHGVTTSNYFADVLHISGNNKDNTFLNLLNVGTGKYLKLDEFLVLLDNGGSHKKIVLDYLCQKHNLVCSHTAITPKSKNQESIKDLLLTIGGSAGNIFNTFVEYNQDNKLTKSELQELIKISYNARALLNEFENNLKMKISGLDYEV